MFISEDTPYQKYLKIVHDESLSFLEDELCPNKNLHANLKAYLEQVDKLVPKFAYKIVQKLLTEKALNIFKEKIKLAHQEIMKQMKSQGIQVPAYSKKDDDNCLFKAAVGKYIKGKQMPIIIQQQLQKILTKDDQISFNQIFLAYVKGKKILTSIDEKFLKNVQA